MKTLKRLMPTQAQGNVVTLAMMVTGIVIGKLAYIWIFGLGRQALQEGYTHLIDHPDRIDKTCSAWA